MFCEEKLCEKNVVERELGLRLKCLNFVSVLFNI